MRVVESSLEGKLTTTLELRSDWKVEQTTNRNKAQTETKASKKTLQKFEHTNDFKQNKTQFIYKSLYKYI